MTSPLFDAKEKVGERITRASNLLICLDFDGTLTPIRAEPNLPTLSPQMDRVLWSLAGREGISLAIVSGRAREDVQTRVGIPNLVYAGNHGLEISGPGWIFVEPTAANSTPTLKNLAIELDRRLRSIAGAIVEDKGLTLSVHYRQVAQANYEEVRRAVHAVLASTNHPFHLTQGHKVYEIRPREYWNKATAIRWIRDQLGKTAALLVYVGDDATDEDVFAENKESITVKVGDAADTKARYSLENPAEVRHFLEWIDSLWSGPALASFSLGGLNDPATITASRQ